ncbi:MAG: Hsp70 family protein [Myxococcales bacterium]|nr:Hsp70 family protein [Myxococcales bacterium]
MTAPAVGIDLGTTNSVVAVSLGGRPQILPDPEGNPLIPSVVSFPEGAGYLVGREARRRRALDPANTVYSVKRLLGRPFKSEEVKRALSRMPFPIKEGNAGAVTVGTRQGDLELPELSAMVLRAVRRVAEQSLGDKVEKCVITVPANFNELQRSSTKIAGRIAELEVVRILNEPTAAALAYGYGRGTRERICIFDFGGGTFDVTLLELAGNVFEVLATAGDTFLGGDDIDVALADALVPQFQRATKLDPLNERVLYDVLRDATETAKCQLSTADSARVVVDFQHKGQKIHFDHTLTRPDLERIATPFVSRTFDVCGEALKLAGLRASDLTAVILVGGSTRIPAVRSRVQGFFGREPLTHLPPEEVVALGASILAEALTAGSRRSNATRAIQSPEGASNSDLSSPNLKPAGMAVTGANRERQGPGRSTLTGVSPEQEAALRKAGATGQPPPLVTPGPSATTARPPPLPGGAPKAAPPPPPAVALGHRTPALGVPVPSGNPSLGNRTPALGVAVPPGAGKGFELDDPFAAPGARTMVAPSPGAAPSGGINPLRGNTYRSLQAMQGALGNLDEPTMAYTATGENPSAATLLAAREAAQKAAAAPSFSPPPPLPPGVMAPSVGEATSVMPSADPFLPPTSPGSSGADRSVPNFQLDDPSTIAMNPTFGDFSAELPPPVPVAPPKLPLGAPPTRPANVPPPASTTAATLPPKDPVPAAPAAPSAPPMSSPIGFSPALASKLPPSLAAALIVPSADEDRFARGVSAAMPSAGSDASMSFRVEADVLTDATTGAPLSSGEDRFTRGLAMVMPSMGSDASNSFKLEADVDLASLPPPPMAAPPAVPPIPSGIKTQAMAAVPPPMASETATLKPGASSFAAPPPGLPPARPGGLPLAPPVVPIGAVPQARAGAFTPGPMPVPNLPPTGPGGRPGAFTPGPMQIRPGSMTPGPMQAALPAVAVGLPSTQVVGLPVPVAPLLVDVTPLSLGVETAGGMCEPVIARNSTIPVEHSRAFSTTQNGQTSVLIRIAQGESRKFAENTALGELELFGLRAAPRGDVSVQVIFELEADGTLRVKARNSETGQEQGIRLSLNTLPNEAQQQAMMQRQQAMAAR